ncbi:uncharacterized protein LOC130991950 [Salvia miltiorrhiza]|uniref:uncharacterized protein LOC130991950 n=1 Tax=Salvia miltiorrhiza TaxID=226208 RepID=UPI0025AC26DF|nr:uncharacterized protein LOC130991950 [Salvia miltiorrhiza]XP_057772382.1 uncharacterized protein LOC130991950 [Salvia miltiorrhiza]
MATTALPIFMVINVPKAATNTYLYRKDDGSVADGGDSMFSPLVKIGVERAAIDAKYVHLRFCYNNRYWQKSADDDTIVAVSNKPEEDTTKPSCTLFEPTLQAGTLYFTHVPTGWRVMMNNATKGFYVDANSVGAPLGFVDWDTLVKLPEHVAFKGNNGKYLKALYDDHNYLQFASDDPNDDVSGHVVSLMRDGHVRIKSDHWGMFWRRSPNWIWADSTDVTANNKDTLFWPVKIDGTTIALRNAGNNNFCKRLTEDGMENCLNAAVSNLTSETRLQVQELVMERKIYNVRYRMEDARIYGETPYVAGTSTATNEGYEVAATSVEVKYENNITYSFSRSVSITAGITNTISAGVPGIGEESIEINFQISTSFEWDDSVTHTTSVTATGSVPVPPRSIATVSYVGTMGTCDIPFSYTQQDRSSADGSITETDQIDGVYTGVNAYNFSFVIQKSEPLD